ncbi:hypothetical protein HDV00_012284 [Rhizophlyctis rosea]|nr:hypothetical protein HDV00_012284 [Rhizophlyctis rosea]
MAALDDEGRPWATVWGGEPGMCQELGNNLAGIKTFVDGRFDPVVEILAGGKRSGEVVKENRLIAGLPIDLVSRRRVKVAGRAVVAKVERFGKGDGEDGGGELQMVANVDQSLGNCPKYLNKKTVVPAIVSPTLASTTTTLTAEARALIAKADLFFIASSNGSTDMDCNHRGGPAGFVRILPSTSPTAPTTLIYPEYSGNRLYQTLGNLHINPVAGLCFPDFETGDVLYVTGRTSILYGEQAASVLPHTNLAITLEITAARFVKKGLTFRGIPTDDGTHGMSPYNPPVRLLASEGKLATSGESNLAATLVEKELITSDVARFRFALTNGPAKINPGQWVAFDFSSYLDKGYSHMRDDDPKSLNDDYMRTFTVTNTTPSSSTEPSLSTHFEITIRNVGRVTGFIFKSLAVGDGKVVDVKGFGGEFSMRPDSAVILDETAAPSCVGDNTRPTYFIAAGIGITPLLSEHTLLPPTSTHLLWAVRTADMPLVTYVLGKVVHPAIAKNTKLFVTGGTAGEGDMERLRAMGVDVRVGRMRKEDLEGWGVGEGGKVYFCAGVGLRKQVVEWLPGREVVFEDFSF